MEIILRSLASFRLVENHDEHIGYGFGHWQYLTRRVVV